MIVSLVSTSYANRTCSKPRKVSLPIVRWTSVTFLAPRFSASVKTLCTIWLVMENSCTSGHSPSALATPSTPSPVRALVATTLAFGLMVFTSCSSFLASTSIALARSILLIATTSASKKMNGCLMTM